MDIRYLIGDVLLHHSSLQEIINRRFRSATQFILDKDDYRMIVNKKGIKFYTSGNLETLKDVKEDYHTDDIKTTDIVFDLGANIGGFTLLASKVAKTVVSVEPVMLKELLLNICLNNVDNISYYKNAISNEKEVEIHWNGAHMVRGMSFSNLLKIEGPCDFLKCDIEGGEWTIDPNDLSNIRAIEMEMHNFSRNKKDFKRLINILSKTHKIEITKMPHGFGILHARKL